MASSLAAQIAKGASLNTALLVDRSRRKPTESYLFTSREADQHDLDSIHALGANAFSRLKSLEPALAPFEEALFSDAAKIDDRTLQTADANAELNRVIGSFMPLLGPYLLEATTGKVIEWLVRRFRVHEFNIEAVLSLFLPYHDAPHFVKMLSILHIKDDSPFALLLPYKSTNTTLNHSALVTLMLQPVNSDFARFVGNLLPPALKSSNPASTVHRALIALHTGVLLEFIRRSFGSRSKSKGGVPDEGTTAWVLLAAMEPLQICAGLEVEASKENTVGEVILSSYLLLSAISHTCPLSAKALNAILKAVSACAHRVSTKQVIRTLASVCSGQLAEVVNEKPLSKSVVKTVLQLPSVVGEIQEALAYVGTERFAGAFGKALITRLDEQNAFNVLTLLMASPNLPRIMVQDLSTDLIRLNIQPSERIDDGAVADKHISARARSVLVHIQQRFPAALEAAFEAVLNDSAEEKEAVEQLLLSLSVALPVSGSGDSKDGDLDSVVASTTADASVRAVAVRRLYEQLSSADLPASEKAAIHSALAARVQDSNATVLEALYSQPEQLLPILLNGILAYIETVARALHAPSGESPSRNVLKAHLSFVTSYLYPALSQGGKVELAAQVLDHIFSPFLLFTKPRQRTAGIVWELIEASENVAGSIAKCEILAGCVDAVRWEENKSATPENKEKAPGTMSKVNLAIASRVAENVVNSSSSEQHFSNILKKLHDNNAHARAFSYLICRALLARLSGQRLVDSAHQLLVAMNLKSLEGMDEFMEGIDNLEIFLHDNSLSTAVVLRPTKLHTLHRLQVSLLAFLSTIPRPAGISLDWLGKSTTPAPDDARGARYVELMRAVYTLANSTATLPTLSIHLIRTLFVNLGDDALKLLASFWLHSDPTTSASPAMFASVRHAAAFLEAHFSAKRWIDFQTVLPAFLVALQHGDRRIREATLECVSALIRLSQAPKPTGIYAFDVIYGAASADLQYLEWIDFCRYVQALYASRDHLLNDANYLHVLHQQHLATIASEPKKEAGYKQRVLCYILSHVIGCPLPEVKISLLRSLEEVSNNVKSQILQPALNDLVADNTFVRIQNTFGESCEEFVALIVASIDGSSCTNLNAKDDAFWNMYLAVLRRFFHSGTMPSVRLVLTQRLQFTIFSALQLERKVQLCRALLEIAQQSNVGNECRALLSSLLSEAPVIIQLWTILQSTPTEPTQRAKKRAKIDSIGNGDPYHSLAILAEIISAKSLPGSVELVICLLETLSKIIHDASSSVVDKSYVEQLLMSAVETAAMQIPTNCGLTQAAIRLDILVELIRVSENPQTFHQALLLMATLARLAPEAVLRNVMPVFTFMGSNVFHRDDAYSFRVVQKTIDSIVPVMVSSLKESPTSALELYISSRAFLRIFTDAANHIPRHRRTNFFGHLIDILGPKDFLAPVCLLLVDRSANRVARQGSEETANSLSLPLSALQRYPGDLQLSTVVEILHETRRLLDLELEPASPVKTFLEAQPDEEQSVQSSVVKRQALALLIFVDHALKQLASKPTVLATAQSSSELISVLLDIAVAKAGRLAQISMAHISQLAGTIVKDALLVMPASAFVSSVLTVLESNEATIQTGALELLADQLPNVADNVRQDAKASMIKIVDFVKKLLSSAPSEVLCVASLHALRTIAFSLKNGEEYALTQMVPVVLTIVKARQSTSPALEVLLAQSQKLGPRLIPYLKDIVKECVVVLRSRDDKEELPTQATALLQALLTAIPNFWGSAEFQQIITVFLESPSRSRATALSSLIKSVAKKAPSKLLLSTMCEVWQPLKSEPVISRLQGYFSALKKALHVADRPVVSDFLRALFKVFLESFELCAASPPLRSSIQADATAAFLELVVKLNEATFRPLFRKMFDWAFSSDTGETGVSVGRKIVFCQVYMALIDYFKGLMTPYMSFLSQPFIDVLKSPLKSAGDQELWLVIIQTLTKSLTQDQGVFWRDEKLQHLLSPVIAQVAICIELHSAEGKTALSDCLNAVTDALNDDGLLKKLNVDLLMHTRSEDVRLRLYALSCSEVLWRTHSEKLIGFSAETATFIAECAEDDNDSVVREAHRLKSAVESVAGRIEV